MSAPASVAQPSAHGSHLYTLRQQANCSEMPKTMETNGIQSYGLPYPDEPLPYFVRHPRATAVWTYGEDVSRFGKPRCAALRSALTTVFLICQGGDRTRIQSNPAGRMGLVSFSVSVESWVSTTDREIVRAPDFLSRSDQRRVQSSPRRAPVVAARSKPSPDLHAPPRRLDGERLLAREDAKPAFVPEGVVSVTPDLPQSSPSALLN